MLLLSKFAIVSQIEVQILILYRSWLHQTDATTDNFAMGQWVIDDPAGIRTHPYSTSASTNPLRYSSIRTLNEVHNIGEVWANLLHNLLAALVAPRAMISFENTDYVWLSPLSSFGCMTAAHTVWQALGVADHHGFEQVGGHAHCAWPASLSPQLNAFIDRLIDSGRTHILREIKYDARIKMENGYQLVGVVDEGRQWIQDGVENVFCLEEGQIFGA